MMPTRRTRPIPTDGLARAIRDGRHRRRKAAAMAGAPALSLVVALVLVLQGGPGDKDSIGTLNDPQVTSTETAEATPSAAPSADETGEPTDGPEASPVESPSPASECGDAQDCGGGGVDQGTPAPLYVARIERTDSHQTVPYTRTSCTTFQPNPDAYLLCGRTYPVSSDLTISPGQTVTVGFEVCRGIDAKTTDLEVRWASGQEHEGYVTTTPTPGTIVWQESDVTGWSGGAHSDTLRQQTCFVWTFSWNGLSSEGRPVPAGTYVMTAAMSVPGGEPNDFDGVQVTVTG